MRTINSIVTITFNAALVLKSCIIHYFVTLLNKLIHPYLNDNSTAVQLTGTVLSFCSSSFGCVATDIDTDEELSPLAPQHASGPLLAFSCAGMLWGYYVGVIAFLLDHFDLHKSQICLSGISAGCMATVIILFDLTIEQAFQSVVDNADFFGKSWFVSASEAVDALIDQVKLFGVTDQILKQKYIKYGGVECIHFGVSVLDTSSVVKHHLLSNFNSLKQLFYAASCSFRTLPFMRSLGYYNGYFCMDGGLTSWYSIPNLYQKKVNKDKIIRIGIVSNTLSQSDICPDHNFYPHEFFIVGDLKQHFVRFNRGYKDAARFGNILNTFIAKGLIWNNADIDCNIFKNDRYKKEWNCHVKRRIKQWNQRIAQHMEMCSNAK